MCSHRRPSSFQRSTSRFSLSLSRSRRLLSSAERLASSLRVRSSARRLSTSRCAASHWPARSSPSSRAASRASTEAAASASAVRSVVSAACARSRSARSSACVASSEPWAAWSRSSVVASSCRSALSSAFWRAVSGAGPSSLSSAIRRADSGEKSSPSDSVDDASVVACVVSDELPPAWDDAADMATDETEDGGESSWRADGDGDGASVRDRGSGDASPSEAPLARAAAAAAFFAFLVVTDGLTGGPDATDGSASSASRTALPLPLADASTAGRLAAWGETTVNESPISGGCRSPVTLGRRAVGAPADDGPATALAVWRTVCDAGPVGGAGRGVGQERGDRAPPPAPRAACEMLGPSPADALDLRRRRAGVPVAPAASLLPAGCPLAG